jgi:diguanylate cyclase
MLGATMVWLVRRDPLQFPLQVEVVHFGVASASLLAVSLLTGEMSKLRVRLKRQKEELVTALATIRTLATIDELTSLANRHHMNEVLGAEERREPSPDTATATPAATRCCAPSPATCSRAGAARNSC